jgi:hypothetical protein
MATPSTVISSAARSAPSGRPRSRAEQGSVVHGSRFRSPVVVMKTLGARGGRRPVERGLVDESASSTRCRLSGAQEADAHGETLASWSRRRPRDTSAFVDRVDVGDESSDGGSARPWLSAGLQARTVPVVAAAAYVISHAPRGRPARREYRWSAAVAGFLACRRRL